MISIEHVKRFCYEDISKKKMSKAHKGIFKDKHWKLVDGKRVWY